MKTSDYKITVSRMKDLADRYNRSVQDLISHGVSLKNGYLFDPRAESEPERYGEEKEVSADIFQSAMTVLSINYSLSVLPKNYQVILWSDFFRRADRDWWIGYYSKSSYYRLRKQAILAFMGLQSYDKADN